MAIEQTVVEHLACIRERDELRAENERLQAEVERLTLDAMRWADENERLRAETGR